MKDIILIQHEPLTERIKKIFCIQEIINAGFNFQYWDISQICNPGIKLPEQIDCDYIKYFTNIQQVDRAIEVLDFSNSIFIVEIFYSFENRKIWSLLANSRIKIIKFERYGNTTLENDKNIVLYILKNLKKFFSLAFFVKSYKKLIFLFYKKIYRLKQYDYLITSANIPSNCKVNHPDYDLYLEHKDDKPILDYKYIVFVDCGFGRHPDELYFKGQKKKNDNKLWQKKLCRFFDYIEKKYSLPVVIAVHPKLIYEDSEFGGRKKIKNETLNLVVNAEFVLQDQSNSISFSIINNKKLGFIVTNEFYETYGWYMNSLMSVLDTTAFNIDEENFTDFNFSSFTDEVRNNYMYNYLTDKFIENKKTETIFVDFLQEL